MDWINAQNFSTVGGTAALVTIAVAVLKRIAPGISGRWTQLVALGLSMLIVYGIDFPYTMPGILICFFNSLIVFLAAMGTDQFINYNRGGKMTKIGMLYNVSINIKAFKWSGLVTGETYDEVVLNAKSQATPIIVDSIKFSMMRGMVKRRLNTISALDFAREIITRYNAEYKTTYQMPCNSQDFVMWAIARGFITPVTATIPKTKEIKQ